MHDQSNTLSAPHASLMAISATAIEVGLIWRLVDLAYDIISDLDGETPLRDQPVDVGRYTALLETTVERLRPLEGKLLEHAKVIESSAAYEPARLARIDTAVTRAAQRKGQWECTEIESLFAQYRKAQLEWEATDDGDGGLIDGHPASARMLKVAEWIAKAPATTLGSVQAKARIMLESEILRTDIFESTDRDLHLKFLHSIAGVVQ